MALFILFLASAKTYLFPTYLSKHPSPPQLHLGPSIFNGICPTSPAQKFDPLNNFPSKIKPPPTPEPKVMQRAFLTPLAAPNLTSASAIKLTSLSTKTLKLVFFSKIFFIGVFCQYGIFGK